jgi:hypothetical protein
MDPTESFTSCAALAAAAGMDGVAASLCGLPMYSSDEAIGRVEELQFLLAEGPLVAAFDRQTSIEIPDTTAPMGHGWARLDLRTHGIGAAFAFPMVVGDACLGAVTVYRRHRGALSVAQRALCQLAADAAALETAALLVATRHEDRPVLSLRRVDDLQQAIGVVIEQLGLDADEARDRIRRYALETSCEVADVVDRLRAGQLRLAHDRRPFSLNR